MEVLAPEFEATVRQARIKRIHRRRAADQDERLQAMAIAHCRRNLIDWVEDWAVTYDPRRPRDKVLPFKPFPRQVEYLHWRQARRSAGEIGVTEKSRDAGVTWLNIYHQVWCWLFEDDFAGGFGSRKLDLVDRIGDPDSIFEKIRLLLRNLPPWMLPKEFDWRIHDNYCKLINPANGSTITGEGGDDIGRGGRKSFYDVDEAAFLERPQAVDAALSNTCDVVFYTSSANGPTGPFFHRRTHLPRDQVFRLEWRDDPRKAYWVVPNSVGGVAESGTGRNAPPGAIYPWYERQKAKNDPVVVASEVDIDYFASVDNVFIPGVWVADAISSPFCVETGYRVAGLDVADGGGDENVFLVRDGTKVIYVEGWSQINTTQTAYRALVLAVRWGIHRLVYDANGPGAGVRGTLESCQEFPWALLERSGELDEGMRDRLRQLESSGRPIPFEFEAFPHSARPSARVLPEFGNPDWEESDAPERTSDKIFRDVKAEATWLLGRRFERVHEVKAGTIAHDPGDMISIPQHEQLVGQISWPKREYTATGLIAVESKRQMKRRGLKSPDYLDALVMAFYDPGPSDEGSADWLGLL